MEHVRKIDDEITDQIRMSRFVVADFTGHHVGVYSEAGFAIGLNLLVIWTCWENAIGGLHIDIRQFNTIVWTDPSDLTTRLNSRIEAEIGPGSRSWLSPRHMTDPNRDRWQKFQSAATGLSLIAVPVVITLLGARFDSATTEATRRQKTVELAIEILSSQPMEDEGLGLRTWAVDVVDQYSGVPLSEEARRDLIDSVLPISKFDRMDQDLDISRMVQEAIERLEAESNR